MEPEAHDNQIPPSRTQTLLDEGIQTVTSAAAAAGIKISSKTAVRWCLAGVRGIRLESLKIRGRRLTSGAALRRFFDRIQQQSAEGMLQKLDHAAANEVLSAYGLGRKEEQ